MSYAHSDAWTVAVNAPPAAVFDYLDDPAQLGRHMEKPSAMMMGGHMTYELDDRQGRIPGAVITMRGSFLGLRLFVKEVVVERTPPTSKMWETEGEQNLLILHGYRMGFTIAAAGGGSRLKVFIDYNLPRVWAGRFIGGLLAPAYARWCVKRMAIDARARFAAPAKPAASPSFCP